MHYLCLLPYLENGSPLFVPELPVPDTIPPTLTLQVGKEPSDWVVIRLPLLNLGADVRGKGCVDATQDNSRVCNADGSSVRPWKVLR